MSTISAVMNEVGVIEVLIASSYYNGVSSTFHLKDKSGILSAANIISSKKSNEYIKYYIDGTQIKIGDEYCREKDYADYELVFQENDPLF